VQRLGRAGRVGRGFCKVLAHLRGRLANESSDDPRRPWKREETELASLDCDDVPFRRENGRLFDENPLKFSRKWLDTLASSLSTN